MNTPRPKNEAIAIIFDIIGDVIQDVENSVLQIDMIADLLNELLARHNIKAHLTGHMVNLARSTSMGHYDFQAKWARALMWKIEELCDCDIRHSLLFKG